MTVFISGGCKNGKSSIAEECCVNLAGKGPLYYLATMQPFDEEDEARIKRHKESRAGKNFITIEQPKNILECLKKTDAKNGTYLLDSVTALMVNELYSSSDAMGEDGSINADPSAGERVSSDLCTLCEKVKNIVFVSDFIYEEAGRYSKYTEDYLRALSMADKALARKCDAAAEIVLGNVCMFKGELPI